MMGRNLIEYSYTTAVLDAKHGTAYHEGGLKKEEV